jgi:8-hydroxy-5-deazaflavin:NADPH oxidoreductase
VLTTPWNAAEAAIRSMGDLNGKIILDATNPLAMAPDGLALAIGHNTSAGEKVQGWAIARFGRPASPQQRQSTI